MLVLGHRGASSAAPENTLDAFRLALEVGADGVELDVRRTADGALAVRHDAALPDGRLLVATDAADLPADLPLLEDALDACAGAALVNIELKNWPDDPDFDPARQLADAVVAVLEQRAATTGGPYLVSSFHEPTVDRVRELAPELPSALLVIDAPEPARLAERLAAKGHRALHPHHAFVNGEVVAAAHAAGLALNTWTVDDPERIRWLADLGVDAVIVNDPAAALAALGR